MKEDKTNPLKYNILYEGFVYEENEDEYYYARVIEYEDEKKAFQELCLDEWITVLFE